MSEIATTPVLNPEQELSKKRELLVYPFAELAGGIYKAYFSTYISLMMTTVYIFSVTVAGVLESLQSIIIWVATPVFGLLMDRIYFKNSRYWPWFIISGAGYGFLCIVIFTIPIFVSDPTKMAVPVACIIAVNSLLGASATQAGLNCYTAAAKTEKDRAYMAAWAKFMRDGMKVVVGFIFPLLLVAFTNIYKKEMYAWALTAVILAGAAIILYCTTAWIAKTSDFEKRDFENRMLAKKKAKGLSLAATLKSIFTNPALLAAFLATVFSKVFYFFHILGGAYFWKFYMGNFAMMAGFFTTFSLSAIAGAIVGVPLILRIFKDTKRSFVIDFAIQAAVYALSIFIVSPSSVAPTIVILAVASFFNGITDSLILSLFAGATDYAKWKYGTAEVGLTMSCFSLGITLGSIVSIALRTAFLAAGGFDSAALAAGAAPPSGVLTALYNMNTIYPMVICIVITLVVLFLYPVNDKRLAEMRAEIAAREA